MTPTAASARASERSTSDMSLFAWCAPNSPQEPPYRGLFAESPAEFQSCSSIVKSAGASSTGMSRNAEFAVTNRGVRIESTLISASTFLRDPSVLFLRCVRYNPSSSDLEWVGIILAEVGAEEGVEDAARRHGGGEREVPAGDALADHEQVGPYGALVRREQRAGTPEAGGDLVADQQHVVLATRGS